MLPPVTSMVMPVVRHALSEMRKATASAIVSAEETPASTAKLDMYSRACLFRNASWPFSVKAGMTALTRSPWGAMASAMFRVRDSMAARRQVTNKLRDAYLKATKHDKARVLDEVIATTGMGRSTARRMLTGPVLPHPGEQIDRRRLRPKGYSDESRLLLEHVWALMGCPCGKYLVVMLELWLPLLQKSHCAIASR